jgi:hypothetical protein
MFGGIRTETGAWSWGLTVGRGAKLVCHTKTRMDYTPD